MDKDEITADCYTYSIILNGLKLNNSSEKLVKTCLENVKALVANKEIKNDMILFSTVLDIASKYRLINEVEEFYGLMREHGMKETPSTCTSLIVAFTQANAYDKAIQVFKRMINTGMKIKEASYGLVLESCTKNNRMDLVMDIYSSLKDHYFNQNSIVFTTIIKGFINSK